MEKLHKEKKLDFVRDKEENIITYSEYMEVYESSKQDCEEFYNYIKSLLTKTRENLKEFSVSRKSKIFTKSSNNDFSQMLKYANDALFNKTLTEKQRGAIKDLMSLAVHK